MRLFALVPFFLLMACGDTVPCSTCPNVAGQYAVSWADAGTTEDGGNCGVGVPRVATFTLEQRTSNIDTELGGIRLSGTLYDTYEFVLSGTQTGVSYRLRSVAIPEGTSTDGGMRLNGSFTTRTLPLDGGACEVSDAFTAQRTMR